jgi:hypothetical protein
MFTLVLVMYVQYASTTIAVTQTTLPQRYNSAGACDSAGQTLQAKTAADSPVKAGISDLRVGYICVPSP